LGRESIGATRGSERTRHELLTGDLVEANWGGETFVSDLRPVGAPTALSSNLRERGFVEHTLQIAIQAGLDVASHIVSDQRLEPRDEP
jgi:hypothetical protein